MLRRTATLRLRASEIRTDKAWNCSSGASLIYTLAICSILTLLSIHDDTRDL